MNCPNHQDRGIDLVYTTLAMHQQQGKQRGLAWRLNWGQMRPQFGFSSSKNTQIARKVVEHFQKTRVSPFLAHFQCQNGLQGTNTTKAASDG